MLPKRVREYELVAILKAEANEEEITAWVERVKSFIVQRGGNVAETKSWGVRPLAYPIAKQREGFYSITKFSMDTEGVHELGKSLHASDEVIRHLVTRV